MTKLNVRPRFFSIARTLTPLLLSIAFLAGCASSGEFQALKTDVDSIKANQQSVQSDLTEIKGLLKGSAAAKEEPKPSYKPVTLTFKNAPTLGKRHAPVTVVEFSDYECPYCKRYFDNTKPQLIKEFIETGKIRYVALEYPLEQMHKHARQAAEAALCANKQGKYAEMQKALFANPGKLDTDNLLKLAQDAGLKMKKFKQCLDNKTFEAQIQAGIEEGNKAGLKGTPGFYFGLTDPSNPNAVLAEQYLNGSYPFPAFKTVIDILLDKSEKNSK